MDDEARKAFEAWLAQGNSSGCNESMWKAWQAALATQPQAPQGAVTDKSHIVVTKTVEGAIVAVTRQDDEGRITEIIAQDTQKPTGEKIGGKCQRVLRAEGVPYPRTCQVCGLGKCHYASPAAPETPEVQK